MMLKVLFYGYCIGIASSRRIEKATDENVAFRYLAANQHPDHDTLAEFRRRHLSVLAARFVQVLRLGQQAGLVKLGHVARDGTKVKGQREPLSESQLRAARGTGEGTGRTSGTPAGGGGARGSSLGSAAWARAPRR